MLSRSVRLLRTANRSLVPTATQLAPLAVARSFQHSAFLAKESDDKRYTKPEYKSHKPVDYAELKKITDAPDDRVLIIDVREPDEVALGSIPSSVNLPLSSFEKSLSMDEGDFTRIHGFHKPEKGQQIIFYCRSGKRSTTALDLAKKSGFRALRNYEGSWLDWSAKDSKNDD